MLAAPLCGRLALAACLAAAALLPAAARATPDGYTLLMGTVSTHAINQSVYAKLPYDPVKDFTPVTLVIPVPNVLELNPAFADKHGIRSVADLIKYLKANPGSVNMASTGNGTSTHLSGELFQAMTGTRMTHVPYKGGAAAITDMIGGRVSVMFLNQDSVLPQVRSGKLRALAVASAQRNPAYPDTPTVAESGYPSFAAESWFGLSAPAKTPPAVIQRLNQATVKALASPDMRQKLESVGFVVVGDDPKAFSAFVQSEITNWGAAAKASGARMDY